MYTSILLTTIVFVQALSNVIYLENCTYSIKLYQEYLNVLWSSDDARTLHIQAIYSLSSNQSGLPGQISMISSRSVALIPFLIQCQSFPRQFYLPFTQCSSTIRNQHEKNNSEFTRTQLNLRTILSLHNVPLLYLGEYQLILFNCSFRWNSTIYQLKSHEYFALRIEYESPVRSQCQSCNRRTSMCSEKTCQCRSGTIPLKLHHDEQFCVDITRNCVFDSQRCLYDQSLEKNYSNELILLLMILMSFVLVLFVTLFWYLYRYSRERKTENVDCNSSMDKHERTPSTISTIDSIKLAIENKYPKIIGEENNGEVVYILV